MPENGLVRIITRYDFSIMMWFKVIFGFIAGMGLTITWMNALIIWEYFEIILLS